MKENSRLLLIRCGRKIHGVNSYGKGKVFTGYDPGQVLNKLKIIPDFSYTGSHHDSRLLFVHRRLKSADIYWINNRLHITDSVIFKFRIDGMTPEVWDPVTGMTKNVSYKRGNGITIVPLVLGGGDAVFVVFREKTNSSSATTPEPVVKQLTVLSGDWDLAFQEDRGAPDRIRISELASWSDNSNDSVKYFSGTATYTTTFEAPADWFTPGAQIWIDLGDVKNLAKLAVNGKSLGVAWRKPFRFDITRAITAGNNTLSIKVTNLWVNRLIGDMQPGVTNKITYTTMPFYRADSPLKTSGLMGPVRIFSLRE